MCRTRYTAYIYPPLPFKVSSTMAWAVVNFHKQQASSGKGIRRGPEAEELGEDHDEVEIEDEAWWCDMSREEQTDAAA